MKTKFLSCITLVIVFCLLGCSDSQEGAFSKSVSYSECISKELRTDDSSSIQDSHAPMYLTYEVIDKSSLKIIVHNLIMNCAVEGIEANVNQDQAEQVVIRLKWWGDSANCICPYDVTQVVGNLEEGINYHFVVSLEYMESVSFEIPNFSPKAAGRVDFPDK